MLKIINKTEEKLIIETDMSINLANAIRRSVMEIPILAVDSLEISKNDSALYDEIIAHRLGLIPLKNENLKLSEECSCGGKGCGKCTVKFKLKAEGPCTVYSSELSPKGNSVYKMPITLLNKEQELEFVAIAQTGRGITHAKFSPGLMYHRYIEDVEEEDLKKDDENFKKIVEEADKKENKELIISIESWGQISAKEIFVKAIEELNENLKKLMKEIK